MSILLSNTRNGVAVGSMNVRTVRTIGGMHKASGSVGTIAKSATDRTEDRMSLSVRLPGVSTNITS